MKKNNYNFIAPFYDQLTHLTFLGCIQKAQQEHLNLLPESGRVLFIGGGTGAILKRLVQLKPHLHIDYIDSSSKMIALSKKKLLKQESKNVNFICGDEFAVPLIQYEGILSFFYFDLFPKEEGEQLATQLLKQLKMKGVWLIADFNQAQNWWHKAIEILMYKFLALATNITSRKIPPILKTTNTQQLQLISEKSYFSKFIFSNAYLKASWNKS